MTANQLTRFALVFIGKEHKSYHVHIMLFHSLKIQPFFFCAQTFKSALDGFLQQ